MSGSSNLANIHTCGLTEIILFLLAILFGTGCSICSKTMMNLHGTNGTFDESTGEQHVEIFTKPLFQTLGMFIGMMFGLIMHWVVLVLKIPFPGYYHDGDEAEESTRGGDVEIAINEKTSLVKGSKLSKQYEDNASAAAGESDAPSSKEIPTWMYFFLAIPAIFDLAATALCMLGLQYLDVSIYQMLRGSGIIFVALMKQHVLKEHLVRYCFSVFACDCFCLLVELGMYAELGLCYTSN